MAFSGLVPDYLGAGLLASRPAAPTLAPGTVGLYYCTDVGSEKLTAWDGVVWADIAGGGGTGTVDSVIGGTGIDVDATDPANPIANLDAASIASLALADTAMQPGDGVSIITEASTSTMDPATHAGLNRYIRAADDVTFNTSEGYAAGEVYNIRATAGLTLIGTGVTLTPPAGGTLDLDASMSVTVVMTSSSAGDVIGQTVPV